MQPGADGCPDRERHTPHPAGYIDHHLWAERMAETHDQTQCPACGLWAVWVKKPSE
jgi:hypothetical protein